jgi:hypothetical protein
VFEVTSTLLHAYSSQLLRVHQPRVHQPRVIRRI